MRERLVPPYPGRDGGGRGSGGWSVFGLGPKAAGRLARWSAWGGPLLVALFAGVLRFRQLGSPRAVIFDETYYAKDAWSLLQYGYEGTWPKNANDAILQSPPSVPLSPEASYVVHPPVGKWMIAAGEWLFGLNPFGWRFMAALLGTLSVLMLCRIGRRLFRSTALGCLAGLLLAVDGLHFVMSRAALLDVVLMFWVLAAFGCLLVDRDRTRARLADALGDAADRDGTAGAVRPDAAVGGRGEAGDQVADRRPRAGAGKTIVQDHGEPHAVLQSCEALPQVVIDDMVVLDVVRAEDLVVLLRLEALHRARVHAHHRGRREEHAERNVRLAGGPAVRLRRVHARQRAEHRVPEALEAPDGDPADLRGAPNVLVDVIRSRRQASQRQGGAADERFARSCRRGAQPRAGESRRDESVNRVRVDGSPCARVRPGPQRLKGPVRAALL